PPPCLRAGFSLNNLPPQKAFARAGEDEAAQLKKPPHEKPQQNAVVLWEEPAAAFSSEAFLIPDRVFVFPWKPPLPG
ncbi:hypothetical protein, partial [Cronobacter sakazakii]|uniref:hypothetical protein n=1 Tax=Cronobacter sakazakii TaxID=28141 RepID=UPI000D49037E